MRGKILTLCLALAASAGLLCLLSVRAHSQEPNVNEIVSVPASFFINIDKRLDNIAAQLQKQAAVSTLEAKLDQILANQDQIKQQLDVIKVRATIKN
jgi:hypothetical protein